MIVLIIFIVAIDVVIYYLGGDFFDPNPYLFLGGDFFDPNRFFCQGGDFIVPDLFLRLGGSFIDTKPNLRLKGNLLIPLQIFVWEAILLFLTHTFVVIFDNVIVVAIVDTFVSEFTVICVAVDIPMVGTFTVVLFLQKQSIMFSFWEFYFLDFHHLWFLRSRSSDIYQASNNILL